MGGPLPALSERVWSSGNDETAVAAGADPVWLVAARVRAGFGQGKLVTVAATWLSERPVWVYLLLALLVGVAYWPALFYGFVDYDDNVYVFENSHVQSGLSLAGLRWAWTTAHANFWHPVTWLSHMLDCQLYGLKAAGHHLTSLLLHAANALLLLAVLKRMTGAFWLSVWVAACFALHPLRVESVAWIAERKDVLSVLFLMLTLGAYTRYAEDSRKKEEWRMQNEGARFTFHASRYYLLSLCFFALGLMSKPMLVTLPVVLLLLDYWPLRRFGFSAPPRQGQAPWALVGEKVPFLGLAIVFSLLTIWAEHRGGALLSLTRAPWELRLSNAPVSCLRYLAKTFWPTDLAVLYPLPDAWPAELVAASYLLLAGITFGVLITARRYPFLGVGWLWYVVTLLPVIGLVQVGKHAMADRYTYIPSIGVFIAVIWALGQIASRRPRLRALLVIVALVGVVACVGQTRLQVRHWENTKALFAHAASVTTRNFVAHSNLGRELLAEGKTDEAIAQYDLALQIEPRNGGAHTDRGYALAEAGRYLEAIPCFQTALSLKSDFAPARKGLGAALGELGRYNEAAVEFERLVQLTPQDAGAHFNLALALRMSHQQGLAAAHYRAALRLNPDQPEALNDLAWILATHPEPTLRDGAEAVQLAERLCQLAGAPNALFLGTLAAAYAEAGRFTNAVQTAEQARALALAAGETQGVETTEKQLGFYRAGKPFRSE